LLGAESARRETYAETVGAAAIALLLYWLVHSYAEFTGHRIKQGEHFTYAGLARTAAHEVSVLIGAVIPLLALLIGWVAGAGLDWAISAAVWTAAGMIVATEIAIGVRAELTGRDLVRQTLLGAVLGLLLIALRLLLH
jgi:hypothetical protein